jgi:hypothetical protein
MHLSLRPANADGRSIVLHAFGIRSGNVQSVRPTPREPNTNAENLGIAARKNEEFLRSGERSPPRQGPARSTKAQAGARDRLTMHGTSLYAFKRCPLIGRRRLLVEGPPVPKAERPTGTRGGYADLTQTWFSSFRNGIGKRHIQDFVVGVRLQPPSVNAAVYGGAVPAGAAPGHRPCHREHHIGGDPVRVHA